MKSFRVVVYWGPLLTVFTKKRGVIAFLIKKVL